MTYGDLHLYWGAVAQVIPVLALAFVIEARMIVLRLSKKKAFKYRGMRVRWAITFVVVASLLTMSEYAALQALAAGPTVTISPLGMFYFGSSFVGVAASLAIVVSLPIASVVAASTIDAARWVKLHLPLSGAQKLRRTMRHQIASLDSQLKRARDARFRALLLSADALLQQSAEWGTLQKWLLASIRADSDSHLYDQTGEFRRLVEADSSTPLWAYRVTRWQYDELTAQIREMRQVRKDIRKQLKEVEALTRADSPEYAKILRANMAASARMPR